MKRMFAVMAAAALLASVQPADGCGYGMPSPAQRFVSAQCVVAAKVVGYDARKLMLKSHPNREAMHHTVAVLKISDAIKGADSVTHIRLALPMHQVMPVGFEGCFFLTPHAEQPVYTMSARYYDYPIQKENNPGFSKQVDELKKLGQLFRNPEAGLTSKDSNDRFLTAAMLVMHHRGYDPTIHVSSDKVQPIDATQSKLIMRTLAECDWTKSAADFRMTPGVLFGWLGATEKEGFNPKNPDRVAEAKRWLKENEDSFRIKTFVRR